MNTITSDHPLLRDITIHSTPTTLVELLSPEVIQGFNSAITALRAGKREAAIQQVVTLAELHGNNLAACHQAFVWLLDINEPRYAQQVLERTRAQHGQTLFVDIMMNDWGRYTGSERSLATPFGSNVLAQLYPDKKEYSVAEVAAFCESMGLSFSFVGDYEAALGHLDALASIAPEHHSIPVLARAIVSTGAYCDDATHMFCAGASLQGLSFAPKPRSVTDLLSEPAKKILQTPEHTVETAAALVKHHADNPAALYLATRIYLQNEAVDDAVATATVARNRHKNNLLADIAFGMCAIVQRDTEALAQLFPSNSLKALYPKRVVYSVAEACEFYALFCNLFMFSGDIHSQLVNFGALVQIDQSNPVLDKIFARLTEQSRENCIRDLNKKTAETPAHEHEADNCCAHESQESTLEL